VTQALLTTVPFVPNVIPDIISLAEMFALNVIVSVKNAEDPCLITVQLAVMVTPFITMLAIHVPLVVNNATGTMMITLKPFISA